MHVKQDQGRSICHLDNTRCFAVRVSEDLSKHDHACHTMSYKMGVKAILSFTTIHVRQGWGKSVALDNTTIHMSGRMRASF